MSLPELERLLPLVILALFALAVAGCSKPVVVDLSPVGSSSVSARARFDWNLGKGTGRWYVRVVPNPTPVEKTMGCIQRGRCTDLGEADCRMIPSATLDDVSDTYCRAPSDYSGTHAFALRVGDTCEGVVLACADL
ncbi:MAG: hypothetical protein U0414_18035 [Polyangiaceae bacterium]